ncbi:hypothetical conserved protein [Rhizobium etli CFN 42]|nr:hypothetical conserved protein [Rhizobium etli CFN 42]
MRSCAEYFLAREPTASPYPTQLQEEVLAGSKRRQQDGQSRADSSLIPKDAAMAEDTKELQSINTAWQIAIQEILRMVIRDMYHGGGEASFKSHIKRIEEAAVDSIYTDLRLRGTDEWTEVLVKERASNFVTTLLTSFTYDRA